MNKIDSYLKVDSERIISKKRNIGKLQEIGLYPKKFDFPLLLQLELTKNAMYIANTVITIRGETVLMRTL